MPRTRRGDAGGDLSQKGTSKHLTISAVQTICATTRMGNGNIVIQWNRLTAVTVTTCNDILGRRVMRIFNTPPQVVTMCA